MQQLAVEIARRHNGEIINGDALQLYAGLPITTNKIVEEDRLGVPHHLIGIVPLSEPPWKVGRFVTAALQAIKEIRNRGRLPILVGGTHYYTKALLFRDALVDEPGHESASAQDPDVKQDSVQRWPILDASDKDLYNELRRVDPIMADRWHPSNRRKVKRSLEIYLQTGRRASDIYAEQQAKLSAEPTTDIASMDESTTQESRTRFRNLVLWVHCDIDTLRPRLDIRVDGMLAAGLLEEAKTLETQRLQMSQLGQPVDMTSGLYIAIGYKEFLPYLEAVRQTNVDSREPTKLLDHGIERTKIVTRQYAKTQLTWIRTQLLRDIRGCAPRDARLYLLDATDLTIWDQEVTIKADDLVHKFLNGPDDDMPDPCTLSMAATTMLDPNAATKQIFVRRECAECNVVSVTEYHWEQHVRSKRHKVRVSKARRQATLQAADVLQQRLEHMRHVESAGEGRDTTPSG